MGPSFGGTQRALVSVSAEIAGKVIAVRRCGVFLKGNPAIRCFRCRGDNHKASTCRGPDRRKLCMTCSGENHLAKLCRSAPNCVLCKEMK
ncbi:cellular nucleic acid-binding protein-like [Aphis craccivora]|uniref:Cellular nucleic acid-binding protein-like n=1 Tax=Aphis craccivora TaxID=307492 RepID=A0A6G0Z0W9_APHCR|nr:cellular nucleic acid-binding protein-like [Aphis craccivora]